ncbi:hypothetical protein [Telluribacter sp.]|uniref:hypothetical protein n=1 Tax=Telluribacter sp. TaxID=1978767 RepID=UPI002E0DF67D|nr:hypothetical protein [Telluribacter sp.]
MEIYYLAGLGVVTVLLLGLTVYLLRLGLQTLLFYRALRQHWQTTIGRSLALHRSPTRRASRYFRPVGLKRLCCCTNAKVQGR